MTDIIELLAAVKDKFPPASEERRILWNAITEIRQLRADRVEVADGLTVSYMAGMEQAHKNRRGVLLEARRVWMAENPCEDGHDHVTPFDQFLYKENDHE